jgi:putative ABC transport system permease protein
MRFVSDRDPGYKKEGLIAISNPVDENMASRGIWIKNLLQQQAHVSHVSLVHNVPGKMPHIYSSFSFTSEVGEQKIHAALISCDENFFNTLDARITMGRNFSSGHTADFTDAAIINAAMKSQMGLDDPLYIQLAGFFDNKPRRIIGVVDDIHYQSMHQPVGPMVWYINRDTYPNNYFNIIARIERGASGEIIQLLEENWKREVAAWPLQYNFVDDTLREHYQDDRQTMLIILGFAILAILLSVTGLTGMALYTASSRTKEIGIRKILGAGIGDIIRSLSREFGILVLVSNLIAWPVSWYFIGRWLEGFAYRTEVQWQMFVIPSLLVMFVAAIVMAAVCYSAASRNPVISLAASD